MTTWICGSETEGMSSWRIVVMAKAPMIDTAMHTSAMKDCWSGRIGLGGSSCSSGDAAGWGGRHGDIPRPRAHRRTLPGTVPCGPVSKKTTSVGYSLCRLGRGRSPAGIRPGSSGRCGAQHAVRVVRTTAGAVTDDDGQWSRARSRPRPDPWSPQPPPGRPPHRGSRHPRLADPSLGALIAEPLFLLADSAFIARVSTVSPRRARARLGDPHHGDRAVGVPGLLHHRLGRAGLRRRPTPRGDRPRRRRLLAGADDRGGRRARAAAGWPNWIRSLFGLSPQGARRGHHPPAAERAGACRRCSRCNRRPGCCAGCRTRGCRWRSRFRRGGEHPVEMGC